jgi:predicted nucleic acid-binding protein
MTIFIDTSAFISVLDAGDENHQKARKKWEELISEESILVSPSGMVETPRLEAKRRLCEMVGRSLFTYSSRKWS